MKKTVKLPLLILLIATLALSAACSLFKPGKSDVSSPGADEEGNTRTERTVSNDSESTLPGEKTETVESREYLPVVLYYQDSGGLLVPVTRRLPKQEGIARAALNALADSAPAREEIAYFGLYPVLPEGTEVIGLTIKDGKAVADFNKNLLESKDSKAEKNIIGSVVYTLTEFDTVKEVEIRVEGKNPGVTKFGNDISKVFSRNNVLVNGSIGGTDALAVAENKSKIDVYFSRQLSSEISCLVPVSFECEKTAEADLPFKIVEYMKKDFSSKGLYTSITADAKLLECSRDSGNLLLYFDRAFAQYGGSSRELTLLEQLYFSMKQLEGVEKLRLFIDGIEGNLPEGSDVTGGYAVTAPINDFIDK